MDFPRERGTAVYTCRAPTDGTGQGRERGEEGEGGPSGLRGGSRPLQAASCRSATVLSARCHLVTMESKNLQPCLAPRAKLGLHVVGGGSEESVNLLSVVGVLCGLTGSVLGSSSVMPVLSASAMHLPLSRPARAA